VRDRDSNKHEIRMTREGAVTSCVRGVRAGGDLSDGARGGESSIRGDGTNGRHELSE
jgi:hypothetical protein